MNNCLPTSEMMKLKITGLSNLFTIILGSDPISKIMKTMTIRLLFYCLPASPLIKSYLYMSDPRVLGSKF